jgi:hypothetical protein
MGLTMPALIGRARFTLIVSRVSSSGELVVDKLLMPYRIRHCVECPKCSTQYLIYTRADRRPSRGEPPHAIEEAV